MFFARLRSRFRRRTRARADRSRSGDYVVPRRRTAQPSLSLNAVDDASNSDDNNAAGASSSRSFRRNQTLSSYRHNDTLSDSERQKAHHLTSQRRRLGGVFLITVTVIVLLALLLWQLIAQVHVASSTKQLSVPFDGAQYEKIITTYLALNPSQRLRFALNKTSLNSYVSSAAPEVENVTLGNWSGLAQSHFAITFRAPVAGWQINGKQYYVDASGVVFEKNYYQAPSVQIVDESGITPDQQGGATVGTRMLGFLGKIVTQAKGRGYTPVKAVLPVNTTRQVDVYFDGIATRVKFSIDRGAGEQMEDAARALAYLQSKGVTPEYIDVRASGRAAYK